MAFELPALPYAKEALEPHVSAKTFDFHHGKHHKTYVDKLNAAVDGSAYAGKTLPEIIEASWAKKDMGVFNNAAQTWNHTFFWHSMTPKKGAPSGDLAAAIDKSFGGLDKLREQFTTKGANQFGSGWVWLVQKADGGLDVVGTANAEQPQLQGLKPLLTCDVWEHAYYLDYQNARPNFLATFFDTLANWDFAAKNMAAAGVNGALAA